MFRWMRLSEAYQMVTAAVGPSVVHIEVERRAAIDDSNVAHLLANQLIPSSDQGSGVIVDAAGYIVTNRHVIADGEEITVTLSDGRRIAGDNRRHRRLDRLGSVESRSGRIDADQRGAIAIAAKSARRCGPWAVRSVWIAPSRSES